ncbi:MAG TPA: glucose-6-phosphate dehydrogenase [Acidimicrobiales bacterium]|nr:glucose-6-phosphate dehydrogenase [Acidimicrobiales bacterium]
MTEVVDRNEVVGVNESANPPVGAQIDPHVIVMFGATGDLAARKLLPGLLHLSMSGMLPDYRIVGSSTRQMTDEEFRHLARLACDQYFTGKISLLQWANFEKRLTFVSTSAGAQALADHVGEAEKSIGSDQVRRLHYLSIPPAADRDVIQMIADAKLVERSRVVMEKPFGTDLASAVALNDMLHQYFDEEQIFRIDHFLGKEAVQNILAFRFANGLFEPIWNRDHIDHVQIDVPETLGVDDRVGFYEATGAFKDMVVTHLFQILGFMAMEPPTALAPDPIGEEKNKVFRSMLPLDVTQVVRGQYEGYRDIPGVAPDSDCETFVALRCEIDNWRWAGVPFFLRTGKQMGGGERIISIAFREPPKSMFSESSGVGAQGPDHLTFDLADSSKLSLSFYGKRPGAGMRLEKLSLQFALHETGQDADVLEAYERLIHDAMVGDHTLFNTAEGIERLWEVSTPLLENPPPVEQYAKGSWGPPAINDLVAPRTWRLPFERRWRSSTRP